MPTLTPPRRQNFTTLLEYTVSPPGRVDRESGILRRVKILGRVSQNGYEYTDRAMREAAALYEGCHVNQDHDRDNPRRVRGMLEWIGVLRNVHVESDGVYGDLHLRRESPHFSAIIEAAEHFPRNCGLSHNAVGSTPVKRGGKAIVETVNRVNSVDLVTRPATVGGLFESLAPTGGANRIAVALESLRKRPGFQPRLSQLRPGMRVDGAYGRVCELLENCPDLGPGMPTKPGSLIDQIAEILERPGLGAESIVQHLRELLRNQRSTKQKTKDAPVLESHHASRPIRRMPRLAKRIHGL